MSTIISDEEAKKLALVFTSEYPSTILGMAKACFELKPGYGITSARAKAVRNNGCEVIVTTCRGDMCERMTMLYPFHPPLTDAAEFQMRIPRLHATTCAAKPNWLITKPTAVLIWTTCGLLAYGTFLGIDGMVDAFSRAPRLESGIITVFGSTKVFAYSVIGSFVFSVVAHGIEASMAVYYCRKTLKLDMTSSALWGFLIFLVGHPIFSELQDLLTVHGDTIKSQ